MRLSLSNWWLNPPGATVAPGPAAFALAVGLLGSVAAGAIVGPGAPGIAPSLAPNFGTVSGAGLVAPGPPCFALASGPSLGTSTAGALVNPGQPAITLATAPQLGTATIATVVNPGPPAIVAAAAIAFTGDVTGGGPWRTFGSSFELGVPGEFAGFYITPAPSTGATHSIVTEHPYTGAHCHKGEILNATAAGINHRAYPTWQPWKTPDGSFQTPCQIDLWVWLDVPTIAYGDWWSLMTLSKNDGDGAWDGVLVNVGSEGWLHAYHVPTAGLAIRTYQRTDLLFPMRQWVHVRAVIDLHDPGWIRVWQDDVLMSEAVVTGGNGTLAQAHFGLYAPSNLDTGTIFNDDLAIRELGSDVTGGAVGGAHLPIRRRPAPAPLPLDDEEDDELMVIL